MKNKNIYLRLIAPGFIAAAVLLSYWNTGRCEFIGFDDDLYVSENTHVQNGITVDSLKWAFTASHASTWQPLVWLSYMLESHLQDGELKPGLFHWTNLLLHTANTMLLVYLFYIMTGSYWPSVVVGAFFGLHPVHTESVVWVAERKDVLSTLFWLVTFVFYTRYTHAPSKPRYALFAMFFILGLMAKPMLVTMPAAMLIADYWPLERSRSGIRQLILEKIPLLLPAAVSTVVTITVQKAGGSVVSLADHPVLERIASIPVFYVQYIKKIFWPHPLAVLYLHPGMPGVPEVLISLIILAVLTFAIIKRRRAEPYLAAGWLWFLVTMLPVIGIIQIGLHGIADRFLYIPAIGVYMMLAWSLCGLVARRKRYVQWAATGFSVVLFAVMGVLTRAQVEHWKTNISLFTHSINVTQDNWAMHNCLGAALERKGDIEGALQEFKTASRINPNRPRVFYNMGCAQQKAGQINDAMESYRLALSIAPDHIKARYNLAYAYQQTGSLDEALREYEKVLRVEPRNLMAHNNMGAIYTKQGRLDLALKCYRDILQYEPDYITARFNLGAIYYQMGKFNQAAVQFYEVLKRQPEHQAAQDSLKITLSRVEVKEKIDKRQETR